MSHEGSVYSFNVIGTLTNNFPKIFKNNTSC